MTDEDMIRAELEAAVARLRELASAGDLCVTSERRLHGLKVQEGLALENNWVDVFEPVRERWVVGATWERLQTVSSAEDGCREFLQSRPDQR